MTKKFKEGEFVCLPEKSSGLPKGVACWGVSGGRQVPLPLWKERLRSRLFDAFWGRNLTPPEMRARKRVQNQGVFFRSPFSKVPLLLELFPLVDGFLKFGTHDVSTSGFSLSPDGVGPDFGGFTESAVIFLEGYQEDSSRILPATEGMRFGGDFDWQHNREFLFGLLLKVLEEQVEILRLNLKQVEYLDYVSSVFEEDPEEEVEWTESFSQEFAELQEKNREDLAHLDELVESVLAQRDEVWVPWEEEKERILTLIEGREESYSVDETEMLLADIRDGLFGTRTRHLGLQEGLTKARRALGELNNK